MSLTALGGIPLVAIGQAGTQGSAKLGGTTNTTLNAALTAIHMIGYIAWADGGSHTVDTSGSSSLEWRSGAVTFANAGTTLKVGLATVDTSNGPPARATNSTGTVTYSVSKSHTGGGGTVTANAWQVNVPSSGSLVIAHGDLLAFVVQMTTRGGVDSVVVPTGSIAAAGILPAVTSESSVPAYTAGASLPNVVVTASDGTLGCFFGSYVYSINSTTQTWNTGSAAVEYGNFFQLPVPAKIYGLLVNCDFLGDADVVLYSTPAGTPAVAASRSIDLNTIGQSAAGVWAPILFATPYSATANQPLAGIIKPTSVTSVSAPYVTMNSSAHQALMTLGTNCYAVNRASGAFAAQNSNKDRFGIGLLISAFDDGAGTTVNGTSRARAFAGM